MKAVICQQAELEVADVPTPVPGRGQLLVEVLRCGICGSDLHARHHCDELADVVAESGYEAFMRSTDAVVMGHEFSARVLERGPKTVGRLKEGMDVVSLPLMRGAGSGDRPVHLTGLSKLAPGGYAEHLLVEESLSLEVPNGLPADVAALTEPMAVGLHAVRRGEVGKRQVAIVIGCGPVGLAVILMLKAQGVRNVVASDLSPGRRALARQCGADVVVDPGVETPWEGSQERSHLTRAPEAFELLLSTFEKLERAHLPWWHVWRVAEKLGATQPKAPVVFECVGVPGMIESIISGAPLYSRVVVAGVCMGADRLRPSMAINKEIELRFVFGYTPLEFRDTLKMLADGDVDPRPMLTGTVGLDGVASAFDALGDPEVHAKVLIDPKRSGTTVEVARAT